MLAGFIRSPDAKPPMRREVGVDADGETAQKHELSYYVRESDWLLVPICLCRPLPFILESRSAFIIELPHFCLPFLFHAPSLLDGTGDEG